MPKTDSSSFMLQQSTEAEAMENAVIDEGDYPALVKDAKSDIVNGSRCLRVSFLIVDEEVGKALCSDQVLVERLYWLDVNDDGEVVWGVNRNVELMWLRIAVGQDIEDKLWTPDMLVGAGPVGVTVAHRYDVETGEGPCAQVIAVTKAWPAYRPCIFT